MSHTHSTLLFIDILLWGVVLASILAIMWLVYPAFRRERDGD